MVMESRPPSYTSRAGFSRLAQDGDSGDREDTSYSPAVNTIPISYDRKCTTGPSPRPVYKGACGKAADEASGRPKEYGLEAELTIIGVRWDQHGTGGFDHRRIVRVIQYRHT